MSATSQLPLRLSSRALVREASRSRSACICQRSYASAATATVPAPSYKALHAIEAPIQRYPSTQPPSYKRPEFRKTQLHRQYTSILHSTPLILVFQHNNLTAQELMGIRRELAVAMRKVDEALPAEATNAVGGDVKLQVIKSGIFAAALRVVEFYERSGEQSKQMEAQQITRLRPEDPTMNSSADVSNMGPASNRAVHTHGLSAAAWRVARNSKASHGLEPLLSGPLLIVTIPTVSPIHLKQIFSILSPSKEFPAPKRRTNPSYHEPAVQIGLQKLMLLGARVEGKVFDFEGVKWVGGIEGGLDGLRAQLVHLLQGAASGVTNTLESASRNLYMTVEGRRSMLEEESKPKTEEVKTEEGAPSA